MQVDLRNAFFAQAKAFGVARGLTTAYPNIDFDPPINEDIYLGTRVFSTRPNVLTVCGGVSEYKWILQISVVARKSTGEIKASGIVDDLLSEFPVGSKLIGATHEFSVIAPASPTPSINLGAWYSTPVQFRVSCFK